MSEPTGARRYGVGGGDAYYDAVKYGGYEGTREQFGRDQAKFAENAAAVAEAKEAVEQDAEEIQSTKETFVNTTVPDAIAAIQQEGSDQVEAVTEKGEEVSQQVETVGTEQKDAVANEGRARVQAVEQAGATQVQAVNDAGTAQVGNVNQAGEDQIDAVEQAGADQVQAVTDEGTTQVGNVNTAGSNQVQAVQNKGTEVINSIPSDYIELTEEVDNLKTAFTQMETVVENTNFLDRVNDELLTIPFTAFDPNIVKFDSLAINNGQFISSNGFHCWAFRVPYDGVVFGLDSQIVYVLGSLPSATVGETLNIVEQLTGTSETYYKKYTVNYPRGTWVIFQYPKAYNMDIHASISNPYTASGLELDSVQDTFARYSVRSNKSDKSINVTKLDGKLVNTTSGSVSTNASYDTYYFYSPVSSISITCTNGFRAVITTKDPTQITSNGYLKSVVYSASSARVETFTINYGQYAVISVAKTAGDIELVTDYVKTFTLPTLRLDYPQKNSFYRIEKSGTDTYLHMYYVSGQKLVKWQLHNVPVSRSNSNTWQLGHVMGYDFDGQTISDGVELVAGGEFELAFKEYGAADYCGGNNHGDENTDTNGFVLMIDGETIDLSTADINFHAFDRVDAVEHATINRCDTPDEDILKHQKIWTFENGTVKVRQTLEFLEALECDFLCCMLAANRSAFTYGVRQGRCGTEDMSTSTFERISTSGNEMMYLMYGTNATAKVTGKCEDHTPAASLWINNAETMNKLYWNFYGQNPRTSVAQGTVVHWEQEYDIAYT